MCGITVCLSIVDTHALSSGVASASSTAVMTQLLSDDSSLSPLTQSLIASNASRGPDSTLTFTYLQPVPSHPDLSLLLTISSSVLGLRGQGVTQQPLVGKRGVLAWNGQIFESDGDDLAVSVGENDTVKLFDALERGQDVGSVLSRVEGPFVVCYSCIRAERQDMTARSVQVTRLPDKLIPCQFESRTLTYQTDPLARRSLLVHPMQPGEGTTTASSFLLSSTRSSLARQQGIPMRALLGSEGGIICLDQVAIYSAGHKAVSQKVLDLTKAWVSASALQAGLGRAEWTRVQPIVTDLPADDVPPIEEATAQAFIRHLDTSMRQRIENIPPPASGAAVLFSGGVDSTLLSAMLHRCLPDDEPIDLLNIAFQRNPALPPLPKSKDTAQPSSEGAYAEGEKPPDGLSAADHKRLNDENGEYKVPDRIGGLEALDELRLVCPGREWRFIEVDVTFEEYQAHRERVVDLMYPCTTEMDLSLAYPLYFASRGMGTLRTPSGRSSYESKAKVYLSGLGPDEQSFSFGGWKGLVREIQYELERLPTRNTSRDDRILSSFARDARYPYLSLSFIAHLSSLPIWDKCNLLLPEGEGEKRLLRLAAEMVGLKITAARVKRAMQFGSRSAKVGGAGKGPRAGSRVVG